MPSLVSLFETKPAPNPVPASVFYQADGFSVGEVSMHLIIREDHALTSTVSQHPVEEGAAIADHIKNELRMGAVSGLVSNHSLNLSPDYAISEAGDAKRVPNYGTSTTTRTPNPAKDAWEKLKEIWAKRELVTIVTTLETYTDVAITNIRTTRAADSGEALEFEVSFQQVRRVKLQEVEVTAAVAPLSMKTDTDRQAAAKKSKGREVAKPADSGPYSKYISDNSLAGGS